MILLFSTDQADGPLNFFPHSIYIHLHLHILFIKKREFKCFPNNYYM